MKKNLKSTPLAFDKRQQVKLSKPALWKLLSIAGLTLISSLFVFVLSTQESFEPEAEGPRLAILGEETIDYGDVKLDTTIETVIQVKNVGDSVLVFNGEPFVELMEGC